MPSSDQPPAPDQQASGRSPPSIPGHQLLRQFAHGSYGEIWLARTELGAFRAVKIIRRANFSNAKPFDREFAGIQRYEPISREHEGLVDVLQVGRDEGDGFFYYVMELADDACGEQEKGGNGEREKIPSAPFPPFSPAGYSPLTLAHAIRARGRLPASEVVTLGLSLARALEFLHSRRLVHRDIKPSNIIFVGGQPKLADVGLIADIGGPQTLVGTEGYIPPEGPGTAQADIYSLGKVLYEAATGKDRQEFPDLPTRLGDGHDDPGLAELNEVLLKACESQPRARYRTAGEMAADLQRLQAGQSLRVRRARRHRVRSIATATALFTGLAMIGAGLFALVKYERSKPRLLFRDDFDGPELNAKYWKSGHHDWYQEAKQGRAWSRVEQSGGELVLKAEADHAGGFSTGESVWVDLIPHLRRLAPCRIQIEFSGSGRGGLFALCVPDGRIALNSSDIAGVCLISTNGVADESLVWPPTMVRIDLLKDCTTAIIYPAASRSDEFDVLEMRNLRNPQLRFFCSTSTSSGRRSGVADMRINSIAITSEAQDWLVGRVVEDPSGFPVADAVIKDSTGKMIAKTTTTGAFVLQKSPERFLKVEKEGYASRPDEMLVAATRPALIAMHMRKITPGFGDMLGVIPIGDNPVTSIGFKADRLCALAYDGTNSSLLLVDTDSMQLGQSNSHHLSETEIVSFADCAGRLIGLSHWSGAVHDLSVAPGRMIANLANKDGSLVNWPDGCAFDGNLLWFLERDATNKRFALHATELSSKAIVQSLTSIDDGLQGLAWDGTQFWISSAHGRVYAIDQTQAIGNGTVEAGIGPEFRGQYFRLAFGQKYLWGLDLENRRICKIKIKD